MRLIVDVDWDNQQLCFKEPKPKIKPHLDLSVSVGGVTFRGNNMSLIVPDNKKAQISFVAKDVLGKVAFVENTTYASSNEAVATVDAAGLVTPLDIGDVTISVTTDARIGDGEVFLIGSFDLTFAPSEAVSLALSATIVD